MVASYSGLYEEDEVEHINCPHPPSPRYRVPLLYTILEREDGANSKANDQTRAELIKACGKWADGRSQNFIKLQISCSERENWPYTVDV